MNGTMHSNEKIMDFMMLDKWPRLFYYKDSNLKIMLGNRHVQSVKAQNVCVMEGKYEEQKNIF